jgi:hypothetical protein
VYVGDGAVAEVRAITIKAAAGRHMYVPHQLSFFLGHIAVQVFLL